MDLRVGDRVQLSEEGLRRIGPRRAKNNRGVVVAVRDVTSVAVIFDGKKSPTRLLTKFLEPEEAAN